MPPVASEVAEPNSEVRSRPGPSPALAPPDLFMLDNCYRWHRFSSKSELCEANPAKGCEPLRFQPYPWCPQSIALPKSGGPNLLVGHRSAQQPGQEMSTLTVIADGRSSAPGRHSAPALQAYTIRSRAPLEPRREHCAPMVMI